MTAPKALFFGTGALPKYPAPVTTPRADLKTKETAPQFAEASGGDDGLDVPSKPIRDPSLDTLLEGLEERLDQGRGAKLRVHTPPSAHTDPFPEEPVVAHNMTAPLSALKAQKQASADRAARAAAAPPRHDPTFVLDREPTMTSRSWLVVAASGLVVVGAIAVAIWVARGNDTPVAPPAEAALPQAASPVAPAASVVVAAPVPSADVSVSVHPTGKPPVHVPGSKPAAKSSSTPTPSNPQGSGDLKPVP